MTTCNELVQRYLAWAQSIGQHCQESRTQRVRRLEAFAAVCGDTPVEELKPYVLTDFIQANRRLRSSSTKKAVADQVQALMNWGVREGRIARNPFQKIDYPEAEPRRPMAEEDLVRL